MNHPIVKTLADHSCDSIGVVNDMYSYWRESEYPHIYENAVKLQRIENHLSIEDAFFACANMHQESIKNGHKLLSVLDKVWGNIVIPADIARAKEGAIFILNWALANHLWSEGTGRYAIDGKSRFDASHLVDLKEPAC